MSTKPRKRFKTNWLQQEKREKNSQGLKSEENNSGWSVLPGEIKKLQVIGTRDKCLKMIVCFVVKNK